MAEKHNVFRDNHVHVVAERCKTCIFRPGNLMSLYPGRVKDMVDTAVSDDSAIVCHSTLDTGEEAVCKGFYDSYKTTPLQLAARLGVVRWDKPRSFNAES